MSTPADTQTEGNRPLPNEIEVPPREPAEDALRFALTVALVLTVLGAVLGLVWGWWSPAGPRALVIKPGVFEPDETESFAAGDARYFVLAAAVGLVAALVTWSRVRRRTPLVPLALAVGGLLGSLLMELVGHVIGGGSFAGRPNTIVAQLPLSLHMTGLRFVEPAIAALAYGLLAAFTTHDDLGHPDPVRDALRAQASPAGADEVPSVAAAGHPQDGWGHRDAAGALQQGDFPAQ